MRTSLPYRVVGRLLPLALSAFLCDPAAAQPVATTLAATNITSTSAALNGQVNPNGPTTQAYFQYGTTAGYGSFTPTNSFGGLGNALKFDGTNGYVSVTGFGTNAPTSELTIEFWQKVDGLKNQATFILNPDDTANRISANVPAANGTVTWDFGNTITGGRLSYAPPSAVTNSWQHFALVASQSGNYMRIYRNGILEAQKSGMRTFGRGIYELRIGGGATNAFGGTLNQFRVWDTALSQTTIQNWMYGGLASGHPNLTNLNAYWTMNEGTGVTIADGSGNGHPGTLQTGVTWATGQTIGTMPISTDLTGLLPATTYHFRLVAVNTNGTSNGASFTFITPGRPDVTTLAASNLASTSATLNAAVTPNSAATTAYFQYGLTTGYGNNTLVTNIPSGTNAILIATNITGLQPGATYHYRVVANNSVGSTNGNNATFTLPAALPAPVTQQATNVSATTARFQALVNPNGANTGVSFNYGTTTNYGSVTTITNIGNGTIPVACGITVTGLTPATTYHFKVIATNSAGGASGSNSFFGPPAVTTQAATLISATHASVSGVVNPNNVPTTAYFEYGLSTNYGSTLPLPSPGNGSAGVFLTNVLSGLTANTTYYYRLAAVNGSGTSFGSAMTFATTGFQSTNTLNSIFDSGPGSLRQAITDANNGTGSVLIDATGLTGTITLNSPLPPIFKDLTIHGSGATNLTISGNNLYRVFFIDNDGGSVAINNLTIANGLAKGGNATEGGGGGAGMGGGLFVNAGGVVCSNVIFTGNASRGGNGGSTVFNTGGGGGGLGGNGGSGQNGSGGGGGYGGNGGSGVAGGGGGGGIVGDGGNGGTDGSGLGGGGGGGGTLPGLNANVNNGGLGQGGGGNGATQGTYLNGQPGGVFGGGGGAAGSSDYGGNGGKYGGGGGGSYYRPAHGGNGGDFGGGGGSARNSGGSGGFGGGGGSGTLNQYLAYGGNGGFGGGAGTAYYYPGSQGAFGGAGSPGYNGTGGGGAALGGAVFVRGENGATLTFVNTSTDVGSLIAGSGNSPQTAGSALFLLSGTNFFTVNSGVVATIAGSIAGYNGSPGMLIKNGAGTLSLAGANNHGRTIAVDAGTLQVSGNHGSSTLYLNAGGTLSGTGTVGQVTCNTGGAVSPGTTMGVLSSGDMSWSGAGNYNWQLYDAAGAAGTGYSRLNVNGMLDVSAASGFKINVASFSSLSPVTGGPALSNTTVRSWTIVQTTGGIIGFNAANFNIVTNASTGAFFSSLPGYYFYLSVSGNNLVLSMILTPSVTSSNASGITSSNCVVASSVTPNGGSTTTYVEYGLTTSYGSSTAPVSVGNGTTAVAVTNLLSGLLPNTTYHYRVAAYNPAGTNFSSDLTFTTRTYLLPVATTQAANGTGLSNTVLNASVNPNGYTTTVNFQYGVTTNYGSSTTLSGIGSGTNTVTVTNVISNLQPNTTYHFRIVAASEVGTNVGGNLTFTTLPIPLPTVTTSSASSITSSNAIGNGFVNPSGYPTTAYFEYGLDTSYGSSTTSASVGSGVAAVGVANTISGLLANTTYHFRLVAYNAGGTNVGSDLTFTTRTFLLPTVTTLAANGTGLSNTVLNASVNPNGYTTTVNFQYGVTTNYGSSTTLSGIGSGTDNVAITNALSSLQPNTTYHFRIVASSEVGTNAGTDLTFTTLPIPLPTVTTSSASSITSSNAVGNGLVNPNAYATTAYYDYGVTTNYGSVTPSVSVGNSTNAVSVTNLMAGLLANTTYHFRLVAYNAGGTNVGSDLTFTTRTYLLPAVTTQAPSGVGLSNAVLNASVNPNGYTTTVNFQYGVTTNYGTSTTVSGIGSGTNSVTVTNAISGLQPNTVYHFRIVASSEVGTNAGADLTFTTLPIPLPTVTTSSASSITSSNAVGNGLVNPNAHATTAYYDYGITTNYGSVTPSVNVGNGASPVSVTNLMSGLLANTLYHFRLVAYNAGGTNVGSDLTFTTRTYLLPAVTTQAASGVGLSNAVLNASVNPNGYTTTVYFQYGVTTNYGSSTTVSGIGSSTNSGTVTNSISGLQPNTLYHFRIVASSEVGTNAGTVLTFTTLPIPPPTVTTLAATSITTAGALLNASVNPNGYSTGVSFEYGVTTNYGSVTTVSNSGSGFATIAVSNLVAGLSANTTYHFRVIATNVGGTSTGSDLTFQTTIGAPAVSTIAATNVTSNSATANAQINAGGGSTSYYFEYGTTVGYGSFSATNSAGSGISAQSFSGSLTNLAYGTLYHFRVVAMNSYGTNAGSDLTFITSPLVPTVVTQSATSILQNSATLVSTLNANGGAATAYFEYGTTTNYGFTTVSGSIGSGFSGVSFSRSLSGLQANTTYYFHVVATNLAGTTVGSDTTFTTPAAMAPTATTLPPSNLSSSTPTMNGSVNPNGVATTAYFQYGATTNYDSTSSTFSLASGDTPQSVNANLPATEPGATYHYRMVAVNSAGTNYGVDVSFQTQVFIKINANLPGVYQGTAVWGDYNNDGQLDIALTGLDEGYSGVGGLWRNNGGTFIPEGNTYLYPTTEGSLAWGDYDNDTLLDLHSTGFAVDYNAPVSYVARNYGSGSLSETIYVTGLSQASSAWGDYDNDGRLDLLQAGYGNSPRCELLRNVNGGDLANSNAGLPGIYYAAVAWGDYDRDGYLDILLSGYANSGITQIWRNTGNGTFTNINAGLTGVYYSSVAWGDYDNDGFLDVLLDGYANSGSTVCEVWHNNANGTFSKLVNSGLQVNDNGKVAWGDYDNDGLLDIVTTGYNSTKVWRNQGNGTFVQINSGVRDISGPPTAAWGDYDNDGRLDLLLTGYTDDIVSQVWRNVTVQTNAAPTAPTSSAVAQTGLGVTLQWSGATDTQTPTNGLTYNIRVGTTPGGSQIVSPQSASSGWRRLPEMGNAQNRPFAILKKLTVGTTYYWSVQAIDGAYAGSPFMAEQSFVFSPPPLAVTLPASSISATTATLNGSANPNGVSSSAYFEMGTTTNYGTTFSSVSIGSGTADVALNRAVTNLSPATVYHYRLIVTNAFTNSVGADITFRTLGAPTVTTLASSGINLNINGTLDGTVTAAVNPNGVSTLAWFQYGLTTNYGSVTASTNIGSGIVSVNISNLVSGLLPSAVYHYRAVAQNGFGLVAGADQLISFANTAPTVSAFADQSTAINTPVAGISFTVDDLQTGVTNLVVTAISGNPTLIPFGNITLVGTGTTRTMTLTPAFNQVGRTTITVMVSDGVATTTRSFALSVGLPLGDADGDGMIDDTEINGALAAYFANSSLYMTNPTKLSGGIFEFGLTNLAGWNLHVEASTNLVTWTNLPTGALPVYQFLDADSTNAPQRYYRLRPQ